MQAGAGRCLECLAETLGFVQSVIVRLALWDVDSPALPLSDSKHHFLEQKRSNGAPSEENISKCFTLQNE